MQASRPKSRTHVGCECIDGISDSKRVFGGDVAREYDLDEQCEPLLTWVSVRVRVRVRVRVSVRVRVRARARMRVMVMGEGDG